MTTRFISLTVAALTFTSPVLAQYVGPGSAPPFRSVSEVLRDAPDNSRAELDGYIVKKVGKEKYIFTDGKAEIRVEIESESFPNVSIDAKTKVRIGGEVEKDFLESPEIDVDSVMVL